MSLIAALLRTLVDAALAPFRGASPVLGLALISAVTAVVMLLVFKWTSDQPGLALVKRKIHACLFEIRLFNDDFPALFRAQGEILRHNLTYLRKSFVPMIYMIVPLVLVLPHLQSHYGYDALVPGNPAILTATLADGHGMPATTTGHASAGRPVVSLETPAGLRVETPPVWIPSLRQYNWRIVAERPGDYSIILHYGSISESKRIRVSDRVVLLSPERLTEGFANQLMFPGEPPLPADGPFRALEIAYPERAINIFGWHIHWMWAFFILSIVIAFALRTPFGVTL